MGTIINVEEVLYRQITRFSDGIPNLEV
jgi:hypothetical protein